MNHNANVQRVPSSVRLAVLGAIAFAVAMFLSVPFLAADEATAREVQRGVTATTLRATPGESDMCLFTESYKVELTGQSGSGQVRVGFEGGYTGWMSLRQGETLTVEGRYDEAQARTSSGTFVVAVLAYD